MMLNRLNSREKAVVVTGLIVLALMFIWFALLGPYFKTMETLDRKIAARQRSLTKVEGMRDQIVLLRQQLADVGSRSKGERPLFSQVENLTEQTGVRGQLLSMRPQSASIQGEFRQQLVEIRLEKISLSHLVKLLHAIEYRSGGIQVKSMRTKPRFEDRSLFDVNMVLMSMESL